MSEIIRSRANGAHLRAVACGLALLGAALMPATAAAQTPPADPADAVGHYLATHPEVVAKAVETYLVDHPEVVRNAVMELAARRAAARGAGAVRVTKETIADNAPALYDAPLQTALGTGTATATVVEFFDFNCGFCRKALADTLALIAEEPGLRIVLKELPIMGADSVEAAKVAIALQLRRPDAATSLEFHRRLLTMRGRVDGAAALKVAAELGFDAADLARDAAGSAVDDALQRNLRTAAALGIRGTPAYVVGDATIAGAVGASALKARIATATRP